MAMHAKKEQMELIQKFAWKKQGQMYTAFLEFLFRALPNNS